MPHENDSTYRVYFNRWNEYPNIWSVDQGTQETEVTVSQVHMEGVSAKTMTGNGDNVNSPSAWIEVRGRLTVSEGTATIRKSR